MVASAVLKKKICINNDFNETILDFKPTSKEQAVTLSFENRVLTLQSWCEIQIRISFWNDFKVPFGSNDFRFCHAKKIVITKLCKFRSRFAVGFCQKIKIDKPTVCFTDLDKVSSWLFFIRFCPLLKQASFFEAAGAVVKICSSLKSNHHKQI